MTYRLRLVLLGLVFWTMGLGLGYPTLARYHPGPPSLTDAVSYADMTERGAPAMTSDDHWRRRVMVPWLAHQVYDATRAHLGSWDPAFFALLVVNSAFCASAGVMFVVLGTSMLGSTVAGVVAALLFLLNFNTANLYLAGLVDAGELFFVLAALCALWFNRWSWLPAIGAVGVLAKETFLVYSVLLAGGWWLSQLPRRGWQPRRFLSVALLGLAGLAALMILWWYLNNGHRVTPWTVAGAESQHDSWDQRLQTLLGLPTSRAFWYTFVWLAPLGVCALARLPRDFVVASVICTIGTLAMSIYGGAGDNIGRPLFDAVGPLLCLGSARTVLALAKG